MQFRNFGKTDYKVSALGFGCMRLPTLDGKPTGPVDEPEAIRMIRRGIDAGINFVDTAKVYHEGKGESVLGEALKDGYREKVMVSTKLPLWGVRERSDCDKILEEQRRDLQCDCIDVYLFHCLQKELWAKIQKLDLLSWAEKQKQQGKIRRIAFSFHDDIGMFTEIVDSFSWDMCMLQYNYLGETMQAGTKGLKYAAQKGLAIAIMEPLFGGTLARPKGRIAEMFQREGFDPVDLALRWVWNIPEVSLVLSGMSDMSQVEQNLEIANRSGAGTLTPQETDFLCRVQAEYENSLAIRCTDCRYCLPCPVGVEIPLNFDSYNHSLYLEETRSFYKNFYGLMPEEKRASNCSQCGECESKCPQKLPIRSLLAEVHSSLS